MILSGDWLLADLGNLDMTLFEILFQILFILYIQIILESCLFYINRKSSLSIQLGSMILFWYTQFCFYMILI